MKDTNQKRKQIFSKFCAESCMHFYLDTPTCRPRPQKALFLIMRALLRPWLVFLSDAALPVRAASSVTSGAIANSNFSPRRRSNINLAPFFLRGWPTDYHAYSHHPDERMSSVECSFVRTPFLPCFDNDRS